MINLVFEMRNIGLSLREVKFKKITQLVCEIELGFQSPNHVIATCLTPFFSLAFLNF